MKSFLSKVLLMVLSLSSLSVSAQNESVDDNVMVDSVAEAESSTVSRYYFVHQYLSVLVPLLPDQNENLLMTPEFLNTAIAAEIGFKSPYDDMEITVDEVERDGKTIYVWQFPEPKHLREALYLAFFPYEGKYRPVAISIGKDVDWEISISNENYRETFGRIKRPESAEECVDLLIERGAITPHIRGGEFLQEGYVAPDSDY